ncbi:MAG TPA: hypothetical protein VFI24_21980 [Pyrinomonadaceae bacterium]|nr:hypothetical protein [Pyrinomonadaceae bacterium]
MKKLLTLLLLTVTAACFYRGNRQSPIMAATRATEFAQAAFVEQNKDKAFNLLHPEFQAYTTREKFAQILTAMNTPIAPSSINATDFEPIPGQEAMSIYITGESDRETFYYRIPMKGNVRDGYKPVGIFRNQGPYPKTPSRIAL